MNTPNQKLELDPPGMARRGRFGFWAARRFCRLSALVFLTCAEAGPALAEEADHPFRFGFSTALMPEVNENDSRVAMKAWAQSVVKNGMANANPNVLFCHDLTVMAAALRAGEVDGIAITTPEFFELQKEVKFSRYVFAVMDSSISNQYVLLVQQDSRFKKIEDLQGRELLIQRHSQMCLARPWLDTVLLEKKLKPAQSFFGQITDGDKLTQTVLPVFFHKTDACLVTRKGFKAMGDLNPQVFRQLRVLTASPELVPTGFFFRAGYNPVQLERCISEFTRVHETPAGQQILTVFQTERLEEHPPSVLDSSLALLERDQQLSGGTNSPSISAKVTSQNPGGIP
jgi:ABC-type phosphate/phosphonate transport system substrate-binding protein